jgi:hypothetical protein
LIEETVKNELKEIEKMLPNDFFKEIKKMIKKE